MADAFKALFQGQISGSSPEQLYTVPTDYSVIVKDAEIISIDSVDYADVTLWLIPPGEALGDEWLWLPETSIEPLGAIAWEGSKALEAGYEIWGFASPSGSVNFIITGMEVDETAAP